jgi:hypothetical protein
MNKAFSQLKTNVGNRVQDTSTALATLIGYWVNDKYRDVVSRYDWEELYFTQSVTASADVLTYALSEDADRILFCEDTTNDVEMSETNDLDDIDSTDLYYLTYDVVKSQPASATKVVVKSSSASDTTQTVLLRGIVSGSEVYESITLTGTTPASAASSYTRIIGISKSASTTGFTSIYENDGVTVLSMLAPEQLESSYRILNVPSRSCVYKLRIKRRVLPLSQAYDYPLVKDVADIIELGATAEAERYKKQFSKAQAYDVMYEKMIGEKIFQREAQPNRIYQFTPQALDRDEGIL